MDCNNDRYFYRLLSGPEPLSVIEKDRAWHVAEELDLHAMRANSQIRTLDELNVTEVPSTPYFPWIVDRKVDHLNTEDPHVCSSEAEVNLLISSSFDSDKVVGSNGETNFGFGIRRWHRCYVVTARARSFLYHQVRLLVGILKCGGTRELIVPDSMFYLFPQLFTHLFKSASGKP